MADVHVFGALQMTMLAIVLCSLGGLIILLNCGVVFRYIVGKHRASLVPILGGLLVCIGMLLYPGGALRPWAWVPLILDVGCLPMVAVATWMAIRLRRRGNRKA